MYVIKGIELLIFEKTVSAQHKRKTWVKIGLSERSRQAAMKEVEKMRWNEC
jgi:hypothetical protein